MFNTYGCHFDRDGEGAVRAPIAGPKRLAVFLSWMASGATYGDIAHKYGISAASVSNILHELTDVFM